LSISIYTIITVSTIDYIKEEDNNIKEENNSNIFILISLLLSLDINILVGFKYNKQNTLIEVINIAVSLLGIR
jgi:hypothetical protein